MEFSILDHQLDLKPIQGKKRFYTVQSPFMYRTKLRGKTIEICIPKGFVTDLMSGPKSLKDKLSIRHTDYRLASIVHDYLYALRWVYTEDGKRFKVTRSEADDLMIEMMVVEQKLDESEKQPDYHTVNITVYDFLKRWGRFAWYRHRILAWLFFKGHTR